MEDCYGTFLTLFVDPCVMICLTGRIIRNFGRRRTWRGKKCGVSISQKEEQIFQAVIRLIDGEKS